MLAAMTAVYTLNIADRYVASTLIEPIKAELGLSDSAIGVLTGTSLGIFYVTAGIPLGVLADRVNRRNMISIALAGWSVMTMLCGMAANFWMLLLARIGVGVGEAGGTPPSQTILADKFAANSRAAAMTVFALGAALGATLGSSAGGWISHHFGWRTTFLVFGLVGLPLALLVRLTVREPRRGQLDDQVHRSGPSPLSATLRFIRGQRSLMHVLAGSAVVTLWGWGLVWWTPSFLVRSHGLNLEEAGALLGPIHGIGGTLLMLLTVWLMSRYGRRDARFVTRIVAITTLLATVPSVLAYWATSLEFARAMLWVFVPVTYLYIGPVFALVQNLVPPTMRAQSCAILVFVANVANLVVAPQLVGIASDLVAAVSADPGESLRRVLIVLACTGFWAAWHFYAAERGLHSDLETAGTTAPEAHTT
ncbi:MAG: spinster family MFS transporter [Steroidobacteraceae bacterium]